MNYYAGMDVSLEETAVCVVDETGRIVKELRAASDPRALVAALREVGFPLERIGMEACSMTAWLHDELVAAELPAICAEALDFPVPLRALPYRDAHVLELFQRQVIFSHAGADGKDFVDVSSCCWPDDHHCS